MCGVGGVRVIDLNEYDALLRRSPRLPVQRCQAVQPTTRATMLVKCEQQANALVALLTKIQGVTPSGTELAVVMGVVRASKALEVMVHELRRDLAA